MKGSGDIFIGIGGWNFPPWRGVFYPDGLAQAKELSYAASKLTAIEINATYYGSQKPESFRKWAREVPDGFIFSVKGSRFCTNRRVLSEGADSVKRFLNSGVTELRDRLGPLLWQFAPTKKFDPADFRAFLELLPAQQDGLKLRHVVEARHDSFRSPAFIANNTTGNLRFNFRNPYLWNLNTFGTAIRGNLNGTMGMNIVLVYSMVCPGFHCVVGTVGS